MSRDYDPDERGRFDDEYDDFWRGRGCCETAEEIGARMARGWQSYIAQFRPALPADPTARSCHICKGAGTLPAENGTTCDCYHCGGHGTLT